MKDSGVEWLGEVPEHWAVKKASWLFNTEKGKRAQELTQEYCAANEGPFPVFSGQTKDGGVMGAIDSYDFDAGEEGAILCTTVGAKAMSVRIIAGKFSLSQNCMVISPKTTEAIPRFFELGFHPLFKHERALIPDHMQPSFRMEDFNQFWIQLPPTEEQAEISKYLQEEQQASFELQANISNAIGLLLERRSVLISAAVTGQIDVRGLVPEAEEQ
jgi:type I restriction enzyme S subunit